MAKKKTTKESVNTRGAIMLIAGIIILVWKDALQITLGLALIIWGILALMKK